MSEGPLSGVGVLVTRPEHQSAAMVDAIEAAGGDPILFPVIDISPRDASHIESDSAKLPDPDIVIFISANAVSHGVARINLSSARIGAVGQATRSALRAAGLNVDIWSPDGADSEHLLAEKALRAVAGSSITIVRGDSGRELLAQVLSDRGASVNYLSVYQRRTRTPSSEELESVEKAWRDGLVDAVMIMSVASLTSLLEILPPYCRERLREIRLVGPSGRVIQTALERIPGVTGVLSAGPGANEMTRALIDNIQGNSGGDNG